MEPPKVQKIEDLQYKKQIEQFAANLQKGDLGLAQCLPYGYAVYGQTRSGKTATSHLLSGNALKGNKIKGQDMVQVATSKNRKAIIGNTMNSQTIIPNIFKVHRFQKQFQSQLDQSMTTTNTQRQNKKVAYVIDTPGYGDTYGVLRILANGYFHYRMYSRVQNLKFILCFDSNQLKNTAEKFISTIVNFTSYFKDYTDKKQQIWQSCVFLFTKVDPNQLKLQDFYEKLEAVANSLRVQLSRNAQNDIKQFISFIVKQKRVFCIKKFKHGQSCTTGHLLRQIDAAIPKWWSRQINRQRNEVDMEPIVFSVAKQVTISTTSSDLSQKQFAELTRYYNIRINQIVKGVTDSQAQDQTGLSYVLNQLVKDAMGAPQNRNFLNIMESYIKKYYDQYDLSYKEERQKTEKELFHQDSSSTSEKFLQSQKKFQKKDKNYLVKKFHAIRQIERLKQQMQDIKLQDRNLDMLQKCQSYLNQMIKCLSKISYKKSNSTQIVYKYGYLIYRIVEEAKMFLLLTKLSTTPEGQKKLKQAAGNEVIDLMRLLKDFMGLPYIFQQKQIHFQQLHMMFIKSFKLQDDKYKKLEINQGLIDFFCEIDIPDEEDNEKIVQLILRYSEKYLQSGEEKPSIATKTTQNLLIRLLSARSNCQSAYYLKTDEDYKMHQIFLIRKSTQQLGKLLQYLKKYQLARKVYNTVRYVDSVCRLYTLQLQSLKSINTKKQKGISLSQREFQVRLQYADYLANHFRQQEAVKILQQAFEQAKDMSQLTIVKNQLSQLRLKMNDKNANNDYSQKLFQGEYFESLGEQLQQEIQTVVEFNTVDN